MGRLRTAIGVLRWSLTGLRLLLCALLVAVLVFNTRHRLSVWNSAAYSATILEGGAVCHYWGRHRAPWSFRHDLDRPGWRCRLNPPEPFHWLPRWGNSSHGAYRVAVIPVWMILLPVLAPSGVGAWRRSRRASSGLCAKCGYDLHGAPPNSPCPECGAPRATDASRAP